MTLAIWKATMYSPLWLLKVFVLFGSWLPFSQSTNPIQCIGDDGKPVDWYILYKFPYLKEHKTELFGGYRYAYITSHSQNGWQYSSHHISDKDSIFANTLNPVYGGKKLSTVFYNDQPPGNQSVPSSYAHAKGVVVSDDKQGFWLIHTVPHFAPNNGSYDYVKSGGRYGQVAMCISLSVAEITKVIEENFLTAKPYVYSHTVVDKDSSPGAAITKLIEHKWTKQSYTNLELTSLGGEKFQSFYKNPNDHIDLYAGIVAKALKTSLKVETWRHNPGHPLDSDCKIKNEEVENVKEIQIELNNSKLSGNFSYFDDHSKWAISSGTNLNLVCLGDINRVESQFKRGGGTTCLRNNAVWKSFNSFVAEVEKCPH